MDAAKSDLMRNLGRLARGLSTLFWCLPLTLVVSVEIARSDRLEFLGVATFLPAVIFNVALWIGLRQLRDFQKQERIWQQSLHRAEIFAIVNIGLSPFLYWWHRFPGIPFYVASVEFLAASGLLFLMQLNQVLRRLSAMLPDEMLRAETRTYTTCNIWMFLAVLAGLCLYVRFRPMRMSEIVVGSFHFFPQERLMWLALFLTLMPVAMTMALLWKLKEAIFTGLFETER
jgi:phosphotransferase system  glucose/maltose/N-acetylglucosamine-specific IIC component